MFCYFCCYLNSKWHTTIAPQINKKQVDATLDTNVNKDVLDTTKLANTAIAIIIAEKIKPFAGTCCLDNVLIFFANFPFLPQLSENNILPVLNNALLVADNAAVNTTKFIIPAAKVIPIFWNTCTKGLSFIEMEFHGYMDIIASKDPT